jgi:ABC-type enterochelin transport system substrate-binding protein
VKISIAFPMVLNLNPEVIFIITRLQCVTRMSYKHKIFVRHNAHINKFEIGLNRFQSLN